MKWDRWKKGSRWQKQLPCESYHALIERSHSAGRPQGSAPAAFTEARARAKQATRKGWPYYIRLSSQRTRRAGKCEQATRKGWPYYIQCGHAACGWIVYSRATPLGVNLREMYRNNRKRSEAKSRPTC